ncbi:MAG TPA: hypothetical protein VHD55_03820 [Candidatus Paceibacterota bacterium]|nr:hypothetical protein [Candidatus Paceibacterota bacterium]
MPVLIEGVISNPYTLVVVALSLAGAFAFITFLRGTLSGLKQLTTINENAEELEHFRTYAIWGVALMAFWFALWETIRVVLAFVQGEPMPPGLWVAAIFAAGTVIYLLKLAFGKGGGGGGHH